MNMTFCRENLNERSGYRIDKNMINFHNSEFTAELINDISNVVLIMKFAHLSNGGFRFYVSPKNKETFSRYNLSEDPMIINAIPLTQKSYSSHTSKGSYSLINGFGSETAEIYYDPFRIDIKNKEKTLISINSNNFFLFQSGAKVPEEEYDGFVDPVKNGGSAVSCDFQFPENTYFSGFGCRPNKMNMKDGIFRMYNFGGFANYGTVPFFIAHSTSFLASVFWMNPTDSFVNIFSSNESHSRPSKASSESNTMNDKNRNSKSVRFLSESGFIDFVITIGTFSKIMESYTQITGKPAMPPLYAFGYHQSRWGYKTQAQVEDIILKLDQNSIPFDVFWLDIDHLKAHAPFTVNDIDFPSINGLFEKLREKNRFAVRIIDPHISWNHDLATEGNKEKYFVLTETNVSNQHESYQGICWPGKSYWPDFLLPEVRNWWAGQFSSFPENVMVWNDMNEPSVFQSIDGSFPKNLIHILSSKKSEDTEKESNNDNKMINKKYIENREIHNIYGLLNTAATFKGLVERNSNERPFILSRSHFSGSQKYVWLWSGDNRASWTDLEASIANVINFGITGFPFVGADVGGFFGEPSEKLLLRWYQMAAYMYPFFREHSHKDCLPREPYLAHPGVKNAIVERYKLLPLFYSAAKKANETGIPIVRPLWSEFPDFPLMHDVQNQVLVADSLMVCPVVSQEIDDAKKMVIKPPPGNWFDFFSGELLKSSKNVEFSDFNIPIFIRGGKIMLTYSEVGSNTNETLTKPLTLHVALDESGRADGDVYFDDGHSYNYLKTEFFEKHFSYHNKVLKMRTVSHFKQLIPEYVMNLYINQIFIYGLYEKPKLEFEGKTILEKNIFKLYNIKFKLLGDYTLFDGVKDSGVKIRSIVFKILVFLTIVAALTPVVNQFLHFDQKCKDKNHHSSDDPLLIKKKKKDYLNEPGSDTESF